MNAVVPINAPAVANVDAEAALCGAMLSERSIIDGVADLVRPEDFSDEFFGSVFSVILREHSLGRTANPVTLRPYFDEAGAHVLADLTGAGVQVLVAKDCARQIADLAKRRRFGSALEAIRTQAALGHISVEELVGATEEALSEATRSQDASSELSAGECIGAMLSAIGNRDLGVICGVPPIDEAMGPIRKKNLAILAARPGMGKTAVALSYAKGAALRGHGTLFISLEMSAEELGERIVADQTYDEECGTGVPYDSIVNGRVSERDLRLLSEARDQLSHIPMQIIDTSAITPVRLQATVRRWKRRFAARGQSLDLVVVDYLQKMRVPGTTNRFEVITEISQSLKELAKANDIGVLALAQLSRKVEERPDKRPMLSDLRESGQLEQDADAVLFLLREEYYVRKAEPEQGTADHLSWQNDLQDCLGRIDFICAKRRKGAERTTHGHFYGAFQAVRP